MKTLQVGDLLTSRNGNVKVAYHSFNQQSGIVGLEVTDQAKNVKEVLEFQVQSWISYKPGIISKIARAIGFKNGFGGQTSGDYIFRPETGEFKELDYTSLEKATVSNGKTFDFTFSRVGARIVNLHVSIDESVASTNPLNCIKAVVDLGPLPDLKNKEGHEVTVNFRVANFDNEKTFWTDSNGLEM